MDRCARDGDGSLYLFVTARARGELAVLRLTSRNEAGDMVTVNTMEETDPTIPGVTPIEVGDTPVDLVVSPGGRYVFALDDGSRDVAVVSVGGLCKVGHIQWADGLEGPAVDLVHDGGTRLLASFPASNAIGVVDLTRCHLWDVTCLPDHEQRALPCSMEPRPLPSPPDHPDLRPAPGLLVPGAPGRDDAGAMVVLDTRLDAAYRVDMETMEPLPFETMDGTALGFVLSAGLQCSNGLDDDHDGLTDLDDPGCSWEGDDDEAQGFSQPQCSNGIDDDDDGLTDLDDPGCEAGGDPLEAGPFPVPQCADGIDDDHDGLVDLDDPGCWGPWDRDERDGDQLPACSNGIDDDDDGLVDMADPGCMAAGDPDETLPQASRAAHAKPACSNGIDDDRDGLTDLADPDCVGPGDPLEWSGVWPCDDGVDDDGDGLTDLEDPGCGSPWDPAEGAGPASPACANGIDDDGDGLTDLEDPGCMAAGDLDEANPGPACANGIDDDGDGLVDLDDPGCASWRGESEVDDGIPRGCSNGVDDDHDGKTDLEDPDCEGAGGGSEGPERGAPEVSDTCSNGVDDDGDGLADRDDPWCALTWMRGDEAHKPACANGIDDDGDGLTDFDPDHGPGSDPGCQAWMDRSERDRSPCAAGDRPGWCVGPGDPRVAPGAPAAECANGIDDDHDGLVDGADPGCEGHWDATEGQPDGDPACSNGIDDDHDGLTDLDDPGCAGAGDRDEADPGRPPACANGIDDDMDGMADYPDDPDCPFPGWGTEAGPWPVPRCANGFDDDGDGLVDLDDPDCQVAGSDAEGLGPDPCSNREDDDGDGLVDLDDPDCAAPEVPPGWALCSNGVDDDGDGLTDLDDPDCLSTERPLHESRHSADCTESWCPGDGYRPPSDLPACANGRDDDGDGLVDLDDPQCEGPGDDGEWDGGQGRCASTGCPYLGAGPGATAPPACANGIDDDGDGLVDLDDPGCFGSPGRASEWDGAARPQCSDGQANPAPGLGYVEADGLDLASPGCVAPWDWIEAPRSLVPDCSNGVSDEDPDGVPGMDRGDGLVDMEDPGCFGPGDDDESDPDTPATCADGLDDDRDGLVDLDDPDCDGPGSQEGPWHTASLAGAALTPDGRFLYVLDRSSRSVLVLDLTTGELVHTQTQHPLRTTPGIPLGDTPASLVMTCRDGDGTPEVCRPDSVEVLAFVGRTDGRVSALQVKDERGYVHQVRDAQPGTSDTIVDVTLHGPDGAELGSMDEPPTWAPVFAASPASVGHDRVHGISLITSLGPDNSFGVTPGPYSLDNQDWLMVWEGAIPGSDGATARLDDERPGLLIDDDKDFCRLGVAPGDRVLITSTASDRSDRCQVAFGPRALNGREGFEYCVAEVWAHALRLVSVPADGRPATPGVPCPRVGDGLGPAPESWPPSITLDVPMGFTRPLDPLPIGDDCLPDEIHYRIRASGNFLVYRDGSAARWSLADQTTSRYGRCVTIRDPHPLRMNRAWPGRRFVNEALDFTLLPARDPGRLGDMFPLARFQGRPDPRTLRLPRDVSWRVSVKAAVNPSRWTIGGVVSGLAVDPVRGRVYAADAAARLIWEVEPVEGWSKVVAR